MDKQFILGEIQRLAGENGGAAPGARRFENDTGIRQTDWLGKHWARWGDALIEAGCSPNSLQQALPRDEVLASLAAFVRDLGHLPSKYELRLRRRDDSSIPSTGVFERIGGTKGALVARLADFCRRQGDFEDVLAVCDEYLANARPEPDETTKEVPVLGEVYLIRAGRHYKIGRSVSAGRRTRELQIQLPDKASLVHAIRTDDPVGIERYWHERFADKRANGEWFKLDPSDVSAFRRRKVM